MLKKQILAIILVNLSFSVIWGSSPSNLPATFYNQAGYAGPYSQEHPSYPARWNDLSRSQVTVKYSAFLELPESIWINNRNGFLLNFAIISRGVNTVHRSFQYRKYFYSDGNYTTLFGTNIRGYLSYASDPGSVDLPLNDNSYQWYSAMVRFAPLFGAPQEIRLRFDSANPIVTNDMGAIADEVQDGSTLFIHPDWSASNNWLNRTHLRSNPVKKLRVAVKDPYSDGSSIVGPGIWQVKGKFDNDPGAIDWSSSTDGTTFVLNKCDALTPAEKINTPMATNLIAASFDCSVGSTNFPIRGLARESGGISPDDNYFEINYDLNWGNPAGSTHEELGSYSDGNHTARLWFRDLAHNQASTSFNFQTDNYAPCDHPSHTCSLLVNGAATATINSPAVTVFASVADGAGSQIAATGSYELSAQYIGATQPTTAAETLSANFGKTFSDGSNTEVRDFAASTFYNFSNAGQGWYAICARYRDNAGNITSLKYPGSSFTANPAVAAELLGDIIWTSPMKYGAAKVCAAVNLDTLSPAAPQDLRITRQDGGSYVDVFATNSTSYTYDPNNVPAFTGGAPDLNPASFTTALWTSQNIIRLRWQDPANPAPATALSTARYYMTSNYNAGGGTGPADDMGTATGGFSASVQNDGNPYFDIFYNPASSTDGCKNVYFWLGDAAGNVANADGSFSVNAGLYCYDGKAPNTPGVARFYSYNTLAGIPTAINTTSKQFAVDLADLPANNARLDFNSLNKPVTNKKDLTGTDDQLVIVFDPVTDNLSDGPVGTNASGVNNYRLCYDTTIGGCSNSCDTTGCTAAGATATIEEYDEYSGGGPTGNKKWLVIFDANMMNAANLPANRYYFHLAATDLAGNTSANSAAQEVLIDDTAPCWFYDGFQWVATCSLSLNNPVGTIDLSSADLSTLVSAGYQSTISANPVLKYLTCGDNVGEDCDAPFNPSAGGILTNFTIISSDGATGSGFDNSPTPGNVRFGIGIDVWTATSDREAILWYDQSHPGLDLQKPLNTGSVPFNMHVFEAQGANDITFYNANIPHYDFVTPANSNVDRVQFTSGEGREVARNVYLQLRDIAGNYSTHNEATSQLIIQTLMVDTRPPQRITQAASNPEIWQQGGSKLIELRENAGAVEYSPAGTGWNGNIIAQAPVSNPNFTIKYTHPVDLSGVNGVWFKTSTPPASALDAGAVFTGTTAGEVSLSATENFQSVYLWLRDTSNNPSSTAVPNINDYYNHVNNASQPCHDAGTGTVTFTGNQASCRVLKLELPFDNTAPLFTGTDYPYITDTSSSPETTFDAMATINFKGATDSAQTRESGLRTSQTYRICYDTVANGCSNPPSGTALYVDDPTANATDLQFNPAAPLPDGVYFFHVRAYDRAGNESAPSPNKQITIDSGAPCTGGASCSMIVDAGAWSTASRNISFTLAANDISSAVTHMAVAEYHNNGGSCEALFYEDNGGSVSMYTQAQACSGSVDFTPVLGGSPARPNAVLTYATSLTGFTMSDGDQTKTLQVIYRDAGGTWSTALSDTIILDRAAPNLPENVSVTPGSWSPADTFLITLDMPQAGNADASSQGSPSFGMGRLWYKIGSIPNADNDGTVLLLNQLIYNAGPDNYSFPVQSTQQGARDIYIWLEDVVGNKSSLNRERVTVYFDSSPPTAVSNVRVNPASLMAEPTIEWDATVDSGSGLRPTQTYQVCWDATSGGCSNSATVDSLLQYTVPAVSALGLGDWYFHVYAFDNVNNQSAQSNVVTHGVTNSFPTVDFVGASASNPDFVNSVHSPLDNSEGTYTFKVVYRAPQSEIPTITNIMIDANMNGSFDAGETFSMLPTGTGALGDGQYSNGELYSISKDLAFVTGGSGQINYQLDFQSAGQVAQTGQTGLVPFNNYTFKINRYGGAFDGLIQVRNNVQRPSSSNQPVIIFKAPNNSQDKVTILIVSRGGRLIKTIIKDQSYSSVGVNNHRWRLLDDNGQEVGAGLYYAVVVVGKERASKPIVVIR